MAEQDQIALKDNRARVKGRVTKSINKLSSLLRLGAPSEKVSMEADGLEEKFDQLHDSHLEVVAATGSPDDTYLVEITNEYDAAMKAYFLSLAQEKEVKARKEVSPLISRIERDFNKVESGIVRLRDIDVNDIAKLDITALQVDKNCLELDVQSLLNGIQKVSVHIETGEMSARADKLLNQTDSVLRTAGIAISKAERSENHERSSTFPSNTPQHIEGDNNQVTMSSGTPNPLPRTSIQTKKPSLPVFSGERSDWPEFKAVWRALAEAQYGNKMQLGMELKRCCKGRAWERLRHIYVTNEDAYSEMWRRLSEEYDDPGLSVQTALSRLMSLKAVGDHDYEGLVRFADIADGVYSQLKELNKLDAIHMVEVDKISSLLPQEVHRNWLRKYVQLPEAEKLKPFPEFVKFLKDERTVVARLAEWNMRPGRERGEKKNPKVSSHTAAQSEKRKGSRPTGTKDGCVVHGDVGHETESCRQFLKMSIKERYDILKKGQRCFLCFKAHRRADCQKESCKCGKGHHGLLCSTGGDEAASSQKVKTGLTSQGCQALYPICIVKVEGKKSPATVFLDAGSDASYVTEACASRMGLKKGRKVSLEVTVVGGGQKEYASHVYEIPLVTTTGKTTRVLAYGLKQITGAVSQLDQKVIGILFPNHDVGPLVRESGPVDLLIGTDYFGLHPKREIAKCGDNLSIMEGDLGKCLVGTHPKLKQDIPLAADIPRKLNGVYACKGNVACHPAFNPPNFIQGEDLATEVNPKCGGCKCGRCPIPGHTLSFKEEQELGEIRDNLHYDEGAEQWVTSYPWIIDPMKLPDNENVAKSILSKTERGLLKDKDWAESYKSQMEDMMTRGAARLLTQEEKDEWKGPKFYINHLAVANPKSKTTPVRIVFNSSHSYQGISLNGCLAKGPDSFANSSVALLLRWREEAVALVGDIKKMFHSVALKPLEQHCHRFLWRGLESDKEPKTYVMTKVNMGDRPASAIASEALFQTALMFKDEAPEAAEFIKKSAYVDDLIGSSTREKAEPLAQSAEDLLKKGGFLLHDWVFSSQDMPSEPEKEKKVVLGVLWRPKEDIIGFQANLNFSPKKHGAYTKPNLTVDDPLPKFLTRRTVLQQVMAIYDPLGLLSPFTLKAKILLRKSWEIKLEWDEELPSTLYQLWIQFFKELFEIESLQFPRCTKPNNAVGNPWLILLSDGSEVAYGCVAYVRWTCNDGSHQSYLLMAKSRIAPMTKLSTPRMELNGAVLSKRCRVLIEKEMEYTFERVIHLVDSETVLYMLKKTSYRFKVYEGVRIGEIQAATGGDMSEWFWLPGDNNIADWVTRGRSPSDLAQEWSHGPRMLTRPFEEWNVRQASAQPQSQALPGERRTLLASAVGSEPEESIVDLSRTSQLQFAIHVVTRLLGIAKMKSFQGGRQEHFNPEMMQEAECLLIREAQRRIDPADPGLRRLNVAKNANGILVVGASRLAVWNPLGIHSSLPILLPKGHRLTILAMREAHVRGHRGRDGTLATFRTKFWTSGGPKLAKKIRDECQLCKLREAKAIQQEMGGLPLERLKPAPPFSFTMLDLFGPYYLRGEVQKRVTGKAWGVLFTDLCARAIHIEAIYGYDTSSFLMALSRFASIRGWPQKLFSDPGSQLVSADKDLKESLIKAGADNGMEWEFGAPDSPWHQGAAESLIKTAKRALDYSIHNQRLSVPEFLTVCTEAANLINERPIGLLPDVNSKINVLTPNCLLLGRACATNPNAWQPDTSLSTRHNLVTAIGTQFWEHWVEFFAPTLVYRQKWHQPERKVQVGDIVLILDKNTLKGEYRLGRVVETHPSKDGNVRKVSVAYKNFMVGKKVSEYKGVKDTIVKRSVQRLVLLVPIDTSE